MRWFIVRFRQLAAAGALLAGVLLARGGAAQPAAAQWGVCAGDPKVWLNNGAEVEMKTLVSSDPALVTGLSFTLHVPPDVTVSRMVDTGGDDSSPETVSVVPDSPNGYVVNALTAAGGATEPVTLTVHAVHHGSAWATASGSTNQNVTTFVASP